MYFIYSQVLSKSYYRTFVKDKALKDSEVNEHVFLFFLLVRLVLSRKTS